MKMYLHTVHENKLSVNDFENSRTTVDKQTNKQTHQKLYASGQKYKTETETEVTLRLMLSVSL